MCDGKRVLYIRCHAMLVFVAINAGAGSLNLSQPMFDRLSTFTCVPQVEDFHTSWQAFVDF